MDVTMDVTTNETNEELLKLDAISKREDFAVIACTCWFAISSLFVSDGLDLEEFLQTPLTVEATLRARSVHVRGSNVVGFRILPSHFA